MIYFYHLKGKNKVQEQEQVQLRNMKNFEEY
jgi:hypothetical protein